MPRLHPPILLPQSRLIQGRGEGVGGGGGGGGRAQSSAFEHNWRAVAEVEAIGEQLRNRMRQTQSGSCSSLYP